MPLIIPTLDQGHPKSPSKPPIASQSVPIQMNGRRQQKRHHQSNISNDISDTEGSLSTHTREHSNTSQKSKSSHVNTKTPYQSNTPTSTSLTATSHKSDFLDLMWAQTKKHQESINNHTHKSKKSHPSAHH